MRYAMVIVALAAVLMTPVATPSSPRLGPVYDCDTLMDAHLDAYLPFYMGLPRDEQAIVRAAWNVGSWRSMSVTDLYTAVVLYEAWAVDIDARLDDQPRDIRPYLMAKQLHLTYLATIIPAWSDGRYDDVDDIEEMGMKLWELMYEMEVDGVEQCGQAWIDAFGKPWNPHGPEATPAASHHVVRL